MKKILTIIAISLILSSCAAPKAINEESKTAKSGSASQRINSSEEGTKGIFKELDE